MTKKKFYICSHTHWDREWYASFQEFRIRLVKLMDKLLDLFENNPKFKYFNLDGQTIVLNDYLEIRPEKRQVLEKLISSGKLTIGPWYVLPDEFLVSGESTIRNLILGDSIAKEFGKKSMVGYLPDMFGHISQMPQILKGFGINTAILWRGLSWKKYHQELLWESPDGTQILTHHLPYCGYSNAGFFAGVSVVQFLDKLSFKEKLIKINDWTYILNIDESIEYLKLLVNEMPKHSKRDCFLLMNGIDHMEPQEQIVKIIERANKEIPDAEFIHSTFDQFFNALTKSIGPKKNKLPIKRGILRDTILHKNIGGFILNGVLSSRMYLKIKNQECQILLEKWVEPFSSIGCILGIPYEKNLIWKAWEYLLQNHPHDDICGCSVDSVHRQMEIRFEFSKEISENLIYDIFYNISKRINTLSFLSDDELGLIVFNPIQREVSGLLDVKITFPENKLKDFGIDDISQIKTIEVYDLERNKMSVQIGKIESKDIIKNYLERFLPREISVIIPSKIWLENLPALGYKTFKFKILKTIAPVKRLNSNNKILENKFIKAIIKTNGTIDLLDKQTGKEFKNLLYFEDGGDNGDTYSYSYPDNDSVITTLSSIPKIELVEKGDACVSYCITHKIKLPLGLNIDRQSRSSESVNYEISTIVILGAFSRRLEFKTTIKNNVNDHRLRVCFPTNLKTEHSASESQFDVIEYPIHVKQPDKNVWIEDQPKQHPQQTFVDVSDGKYGFGIINFGLPEYEVLNDKRHTICLTLLRSVGYLSVSKLNTRNVGAGPEIEVPEAQCQRELVFCYAVFPHKGKWYDSNIQYQAHEFNNGFFVMNTDKHKGDLPLQKSFVKVEGDGIILSAIKKAENDNSIIIRFYNTISRQTNAKLVFCKDIKKIYLTNLNEEIKEEIELNDKRTIEILVVGFKIITLKVVV